MLYDLIIALIPEVGVPVAVIMFAFTVYILEKRNKNPTPTDDVQDADSWKLWYIQHVKEPIIEEIRKVKDG